MRAMRAKYKSENDDAIERLKEDFFYFNPNKHDIENGFCSMGGGS